MTALLLACDIRTSEAGFIIAPFPAECTSQLHSVSTAGCCDKLATSHLFPVTEDVFPSIDIPDVFLVEPHVFEDPRGVFRESCHKEQFSAVGLQAKSIEFVRDNTPVPGEGPVLSDKDSNATPLTPAEVYD